MLENDAPELLDFGAHTGTSIARFAARTVAVGEYFYGQGHVAEDHTHHAAFLSLTIAGSAPAEIRGTSAERSFQPGALSFVPAGAVCSHQHVGCWQNVLMIDLADSYASDFDEYGLDFSTVIERFDPGVVRFVGELQREIREPDSLSHIHVRALVSEICVSLLRQRRRESETMPHWLKRIVGEIDERFREDLSLEALASSAHVHPVHVSRTFRRCLGETLRDYIHRLRIREARRLLETSKSPAEIAAEIGYYDESHFCRAFKKAVGATPSHYRRARRGR